MTTPRVSRIALGAAGELLAASHFALRGWQVYRPMADDRGVDLLVDVGDGAHLAVQVKTALRPGGTYVFMRKSGFPLVSWLALCLVVFDGALDRHPDLFLFPSTAWSPSQLSSPLVDRNYGEGLASPPEFGLNLRRAWRDELSKWSATDDHTLALITGAHPASGRG